ncbi:DUF1015 domain-containing protein [Fournierella massiliensis]|uniref:DUF1015 domain-containing protein n=1 Tax=Allofournierella massiliensis TaxID=1650663 RepID=UPI002941E553|nr:DUF1015 domain-containing protein [Fournierella massiliensis]
MQRCTKPAAMLLPAPEIDLEKWAVVACDQYTSQPDYWCKVQKLVGDAPSTLRLTLPEIWLEETDAPERIKAIGRTMEEYQTNGLLRPTAPGMMLVRRQMEGVTAPRWGLVMAVDLEAYDYREGSNSPIRPTERTVPQRIPARLAVREAATLELPHILLLIDDPQRSVIEPVVAIRDELEKAYDTPLMLGGGQLTGWFIPEGPLPDKIQQALETLAAPERLRERYGAPADAPALQFATGDGNHSMAAARARWEQIRETLTPQQRLEHPARWALAEVVNLQDESLEIEPIHRLVAGVNPQTVLQDAVNYFAAQGAHAQLLEQAPEKEDPWAVRWVAGEKTGWLCIQPNGRWALPVAALQAFLDDRLPHWQGAKPDYIHGEETLCNLCAGAQSIGFVLPEFRKEDLFRGVVLDGVLPRKTFSMGRAQDKRYYMEARRIMP